MNYNGSNLLQEIKESLAHNGMEDAIQKLKDTSPIETYYDNILLIEREYKDINIDYTRGIISEEYKRLSYNRMNDKILNLINQIQNHNNHMLGKSNNNNLTNVTRKNAASISELINEIEIATPRGYLNRETQSLILNKNIILNKYNNSLNISHLREVRKKYEDSFWKVKSFKTELQWSVFIDLSKISSIGIASTPKNIEDYFHEDLQTITFVSRSTLKGIKTKTEYLEVNNSSFSFPGREYSKTDLHEKQIHEMYLSGAKLDIEQFVQSFNQVLKEIKNH